jgi:hypothetical protein
MQRLLLVSIIHTLKRVFLTKVWWSKGYDLDLLATVAVLEQKPELLTKGSTRKSPG